MKYLITPLCIYLMGAFAHASLNIYEWDSSIRITCAIIAGLGTVFLATLDYFNGPRK